MPAKLDMHRVLVSGAQVEVGIWEVLVLRYECHWVAFEGQEGHYV